MPLHFAVWTGQMEAAKLLVSALWDGLACRGGEGGACFVQHRRAGMLFGVRVTARLAAIQIRAKCRLNASSHSDSLGLVTCNAGSTPLHLAAMKGNMEMATWILETWATVRHPGILCTMHAFIRHVRQPDNAHVRTPSALRL